MLFTSPRNSLEAQLSLLDAANCQLILVPQNPPIFVSDLLQRNLRSINVPSHKCFMDKKDPLSRGRYPYNKTFEYARSDPFVVFQTSGSTGLPKPVVTTHGTFSTIDAQRLVSSLSQEASVSGFIANSRWFNGFPHYHTGFHLFTLAYGLFHNICTVIAPSQLLNASAVNSLQIYGACNGLVTPPSLLDDLSRDPEHLEDLRKLRFVTYAGGPLSRSGGDRIALNTKVLNLPGSTERSMYSCVLHKESWEYIQFSHLLGTEFRLIGDNLYELFFVRGKENDLFQAAFCTLPNLSEYGTRELYAPHPLINAWPLEESGTS